MSLKIEKLAVINQIISLEDEMLLQTIQHLLTIGSSSEQAESDFWDELSPKQKASVQRSLEDFDNGYFIENEAVMNEMRQRFAI